MPHSSGLASVRDNKSAAPYNRHRAVPLQKMRRTRAPNKRETSCLSRATHRGDADFAGVVAGLAVATGFVNEAAGFAAGVGLDAGVDFSGVAGCEVAGRKPR